ncbi:MAG: 2-oxo acid dehydrogenase subunit E2 [Spirochaetales bacterium]|jgi:pyruvate dehydrogenase E2 component (dihydrolipoamide acetyltransferase)|nr:2-oxo acid dehydrogenase subunit E2 [Spirochaetales bacterium]
MTEILMPRQGQSVESCIILSWKKHEGDVVKTGDILCEVETDKATFEIEAGADGILLKITQPEGADVPVLTPIAYIGQAGEAVPDQAAAPASPTPAPSPASAPVPTPSVSPAPVSASVMGAGTGGAGVYASPRARNLAEAKGLVWQSLAGSGPGGRVIERDVLAALRGREPLSPAAVEGVISAHLQAPASGSGPGGRVLRSDLAASPAAAALSGSPAASAADFPGPVEEVPTKGIRKLIADRMLQSLHSHAQLTLNASADARALQAFRKKLKGSEEALGLNDITLNDFILYAVSRTLPLHPSLNALWAGDRILRYARVHLAFAVDTPRGLMVPVIRNAQALSLKAISAEAKRLARACVEGGITPDELSGGTFTVSNLGGLGVENFTPILNSPQVGILGVGTIVPKPCMAADEVKFIPSLGLSLTIDHQAVDGAPGARFLQSLCEALAGFDILLAKG